jgi:hypothetical protein
VKGRELAAIRQSTSMGTAFTRSQPTTRTSNPQSAGSQQPAASSKASSKADNIGKVQQYAVVPEHCATKACLQRQGFAIGKIHDNKKGRRCQQFGFP